MPSSGSNTVDDATIELATARVHESIRSLLADEFPELADQKGHKALMDPYLYLSYESFISYLNFIYVTWSAVAVSFWHLCKFQIQIVDFLTLLFFSLLVSVVLTMGVFTCLVCKLPLVEQIFSLYSRVHGGFGLTNSLNTHMFTSLTSKEVRLSKAALASTDPVTGKHFNLERTSETTREALKHSRSVARIPVRKSTSPRAMTPTTGSFPMASPPTSPNPLTPPPSRPTHSGSSHRHSHHHSRSLSHFASQMQSSLDKAQAHARDSYLLKLFGKSANSIRSILQSGKGDNVIQDLVGRLMWILPNFDEWLTDFDITRVEAGHRLPGLQTVHRGFKNRLFPDNDAMHRTPYETIMAALKVVTNDLASRTDKEINVWFTGHSLGCAMATLTYTRACLGLDGLHPRVELCDAYLYGAPVVCDMASAKVFNDFMAHRQSTTGKTRTVWRVTNHSDAVTTLLPMLGDDPLYPNTTSLSAYAHIGSEVKMRPGAGKSIIVDNYCTPGIPARAVSAIDIPGSFESDDETEVDPIGYGMNSQEYKDMKGGKKTQTGVPWWISGLEYVPLFGRMISHFPGLYFRSLQQMGPGDFVWRRS